MTKILETLCWVLALFSLFLVFAWGGQIPCPAPFDEIEIGSPHEYFVFVAFVFIALFSLLGFALHKYN